MKIVLQKCNKASVTINDKIYNEINKGYLLLVSFTEDDNKIDIDYMIKKILNLKLFDNKNIKEIDGSILSISQFTLYGSVKKGTKPSFTHALEFEKAKVLYEEFNNKLKQEIDIKTGIFGEYMIVSLENDGPYTLIIDSKEK